jgi:diadenosine tetraphosphatase ApaH/serine/threonine PP2A family protein phosphatase
MTTRAIIADIHANFTALEAVFADGDALHVDEWVCLGDICGYGPDPVECVDLIRKRCKWSLCGNHDTALFLEHPVGFNKLARDAILWHKSLLKPKLLSMPAAKRRWAWLKQLKAMLEEDDIIYVHASPREPLTEYTGESDLADLGFGPSRKIIEIFERIKRLCFCGHSHWPGIAMSDCRWISMGDLPDLTFTPPTNRKALINVGSVGQPRDRNPNSCYAIHDTVSGQIRFRRVSYDIAAAQKRFESAPVLDERLKKRLETGS